MLGQAAPRLLYPSPALGSVIRLFVCDPLRTHFRPSIFYISLQAHREPANCPSMHFSDTVLPLPPPISNSRAFGRILANSCSYLISPSSNDDVFGCAGGNREDGYL